MRQTVLIVAVLMMFTAVDATAETRQLNFTDFDEVSVGPGMQVSVNQGARYRIEATGSTADLDRLRVNHQGNRLTFSIESGFLGSFRAGRINLSITLPALRSLDLSGGSDGTLDVQRGTAPFTVALSGGSKLNGQLACGNVQLALSGGSRISVSGAGQNLVLEASGGSRFELKTFSVKDVTASLSGGSQAILTLDGELTARLSGGSHINYFGNAALTAVQTSGGSKVSKGL